MFHFTSITLILPFKYIIHGCRISLSKTNYDILIHVLIQHYVKPVLLDKFPLRSYGEHILTYLPFLKLSFISSFISLYSELLPMSMKLGYCN